MQAQGCGVEDWVCPLSHLQFLVQLLAKPNFKYKVHLKINTAKVIRLK